MNHKEIFTEIYEKNIWGGSGGGSLPQVTGQYRLLITRFIITRSIKSVIDFGCGDWAFSHLIDWQSVDYTGIDCVQSVIDRNIEKYSAPKRQFICSDDVEGTADLLILKDVLQHWTNKQVEEFLDSVNIKYILITNSSGQSEDWEDNDTPHINTRGLSAYYYPLKKYNPVILLETNVNEPKETCLITK